MLLTNNQTYINIAHTDTHTYRHTANNVNMVHIAVITHRIRQSDTNINMRKSREMNQHKNSSANETKI